MDSTNLIITAVAGIFILLILILFTNGVFSSLLGSASSNQHLFLILGPPGSGKSSLFHLLTTGSTPKFNPVLSQTPNEITNFVADDSISEKYLLREYPGSTKLTSLYLYRDLGERKFLKKLKGIVIVVDSSVSDLQPTLNLVYNILQHTEYLPTGVDILLLCNKLDLFQSKPVFKIREILETEIAKLIVSKQQGLGEIDHDLLKAESTADFSDTPRLSLDSSGRFKFDSIEGNFDFIEGSVTKNKIDKWTCWIAERAVN